MNIELNKLYLKLDNNFKIQGYFKQFNIEPHYSAVGCEFDLKTDLENSVICEQDINTDDIYIGESQYVNGIFIQNKPIEE